MSWKATVHKDTREICCYLNLNGFSQLQDSGRALKNTEKEKENCLISNLPRDPGAPTASTGYILLYICASLESDFQ